MSIIVSTWRDEKVKWDQDAANRLARVPFFIRKKVKKQIEAFVLAKGKDIITSDDVSEARQQLTGTVPLKTSQGELSEAELKRITELVDKGIVIEGLDTKHVKFKVCGGAGGCPLALFETEPISTQLANLANEQGLDSFLSGSIDGPVLFHHQFKIAVVGCPNNCAQPQITDFAVIGQAKPIKVNSNCNQCQLCVEACKEQAITLNADGPVFDYDLCLNCGDCTRYCAKEVIVDSPVTYQVLIGGKLGRHPHLAVCLADMVSWEMVQTLFQATIEVYTTKAFDGERFGNLVQRLGASEIVEMIHEQAKNM